MGKLLDAMPDCFLKKICLGENSDIVENVLATKNMFEKEQDREKKVIYKERLSSSFWNLYAEVGKKISRSMAKEKRLFIRFGLFDLKYLTADEQKLVLSQKFDDPDPENSVFYADEWLMAISEGRIKPSIVDEATRTVAEKRDAGLQTKFERIQGSMEGDRRNYTAFADKRKVLEDALISLAQRIAGHPLEPLLNYPDNYTEDQIKNMDEMLDAVRDLRKIDKDMKQAKDSYYDKNEEYKEVQQEMTGAMQSQGDGQPVNYGAADIRTMENEITNALRQMTKMCVGRQGNHFPILISGFLPKETNEYNFKSNAIARLKETEGLDPTIFERTFKQNTSRIPPYIILMPGYGNLGICWEPYDKYNKASSKGRIAIPIFTRTPKLAITMALGDFRWQVAKEMAGYHWMDPTEGITGRYYEYLSENKIKGDIKSLFIEDYILWITKESDAVQKLHKDVRYMFWRFIPFPESVKENLKNKGYYYSDLYEKEKIYKMSQ